MKKLLLILKLIFTTYSFAQTINIPVDQPTIQAGIDAASNGDTVLVAEGTYLENINFKGKAITVASHFILDQDTSHISKTIIDGSQHTDPDSGSVVYFVSGEDTSSVICGFTITGGDGTYIPAGIISESRAGGGIFCMSNARISNNKIVNNSISSSSMVSIGAGIVTSPADTVFIIVENNYICFNTVNTQGPYLTGGGGIGFACRGRITNNDISHNQAIAQDVQATGGGLSMQGTQSVIISGNTISYNKVIATGNFEWGGHGGGLSTMGGSDLTVIGNRFFSNEINVAFKSNGAGVLLEHTTGAVVFENNVVFDNYISGAGTCNGGGVCIWKCEATLNANQIYGNKGTYGGGLFVSHNSGSPIVKNNIVKNNRATQGGGIYLEGPQTQVQIINNTIVADSAAYGGGIYTLNTSPVIMNSILWNNDAVSGSQIYKSGGNIQVVYSDVQRGWVGEGNIDVNPMFTDTLFHLSDSSSCIGRGRTSYSFAGTVLNAPEYDFDGNVRPSLGSRKPDIGAMENTRAYPLLPVIQIPDDYPTIQDGVNAAANGDTVLVAEGTYYENVTIESKAITLASYFLIDEDTSHISRTIINGSQPVNSDNASVVSFLNSPDSNVLCGFTITGGYGTKKEINNNIYRGGGGVFLSGSSATISNNYIVTNAIDNVIIPEVLSGAQGGGILFDVHGISGLTLKISENIIAKNIAQSEMTGGGAISIGSFYKDVIIDYTIEKNIIRNNSAINTDDWKAMGGGIFLEFYLPTNGTQIIRNNIISYNQAICNTVSKHSFGGGLYFIILDTENAIDHNPSPYIYNNLIYGNNSDYLGGGVAVWRANYTVINPAIPLTAQGRYTPKPSFINNTIVNNTAKDGSGFYIMNHKPFLMNNILWNDHPQNAVWGEIFLGDEPQWTAWVEPNTYGGTEIYYTDIQGGWDKGEGNVDNEPIFYDKVNEDFRFMENSPGIGWGIDSLLISGINYISPTTDYFGNIRPNSIDEFIDMGALESPYKKTPPTAVADVTNLIPEKYALKQNYPNPFNPSTTIKYTIPNKTHLSIPSREGKERSDRGVLVTLKVYDILGREVTTLVNKKQKTGFYEVEFDASGLTSGIYFYRLNAGGASTSSAQGFVETKKMVLMK